MKQRLASLIILVAMLLLTVGGVAAQAGANRAGLVIRWADKRVGTYVVSFNEDSISGADLLRRALGDAVEVDWQAGGIVAAISGVGCHPPADGAFCQCQGGASCTYWRYYHLQSGKWTYSNLGASSYQVRNGAVEGWSWANGDEAPPVYTFAQLTSPPPTKVAVRTATPTPTRKPKVTNTAKSTRTPTATPIQGSNVGSNGGPPPTPAIALSSDPPPPPTTPASSNMPAPPSSPTATPIQGSNVGSMGGPPPAATEALPSYTPPPYTPPTIHNSQFTIRDSFIPILSLFPFILAAVLARRGSRLELDSRTWLVWLVAALLFVSNNPYFLVMLLLVCLSVYFACATVEGMTVSGRLLVRFGGAVTFVIALFNFVTAHYGTTVIAMLPQDWPLIGGIVTLEGLVAGLLRGLSLLSLLAVFAVFNRVVDHYELLKLTPRPLYRIGLAVSIAVAFVPQTLAAAQEIAAAQQLRGYKVRVRDLLPLFAPLLTLGLEKAVQMAEALETRAWGNTAARRTHYRHVNLRRADYIVIITAILAAGLAIGARLLGWLPDYYPYPRLSLPNWSGAALLMLLLLTPFVLARSESVTQRKQQAAIRGAGYEVVSND